ncbi:hypothetical protein Hdeb2414_s0013g00403451 [Helianthus debilis subsp. tardiflorus]
MSFVVDSISHSRHVKYLQNTKIGYDSKKQNLSCDSNNKQIKGNVSISNIFNTKVQSASCDGTNIRSVQVGKIPLRYEINETRSSSLLLDSTYDGYKRSPHHFTSQNHQIQIPTRVISV